MSFKNNLKYLREKSGLSYQELANELGIKNRSLICNWERGVCLPGMDKFLKLSEHFKCNINDLMKTDLSKVHSNEPFIDVLTSCTISANVFLNNTQLEDISKEIKLYFTEEDLSYPAGLLNPMEMVIPSNRILD